MLRYFRVTKAFAPEGADPKTKIVFVVQPLEALPGKGGVEGVGAAELQAALSRRLVAEGFERQMGSAPRGPLERALGTMLQR